jgi:hypothetical protein
MSSKIWVFFVRNGISIIATVAILVATVFLQFIIPVSPKQFYADIH